MKLADKSIVHLSIVPHFGVIAPPPWGDNKCRFRVIAGSQFVGKYYHTQTVFFMSELWLILQNVENYVHHKVNELQLLIEV